MHRRYLRRLADPYGLFNDTHKLFLFCLSARVLYKNHSLLSKQSSWDNMFDLSWMILLEFREIENERSERDDSMSSPKLFTYNWGIISVIIIIISLFLFRMRRARNLDS